MRRKWLVILCTGSFTALSMSIPPSPSKDHRKTTQPGQNRLQRCGKKLFQATAVDKVVEWPRFEEGSKVMSFSESRIHFDKARNGAVDPAIKEIAEGLKHLSHAIEEDLRKVEEDIRAIQNQPK